MPLPLLLWLLACQRTAPSLTCPADMAQIQGGDGPFCIHRYEVSLATSGPARPGNIQEILRKYPDEIALRSEAGLQPTQVSWRQARDLCAQQGQGMHLCTSAEWEDACDQQPGPGGQPYATTSPATYQQGDCNFSAEGAATAPLSVTGAFPRCQTPTGVFDLLGNLWEWSDPGQQTAQGQPIIDKRGGAHYSRRMATCQLDAVGQHPPDATPSVGFRCCTAPASR